MTPLLFLMLAQKVTLEGIVRAPSGDAVVATVVVGENRTQTGRDGRYSFQLEAGSYTLRAEAAGYATFTAGPFPLKANERRNITLAPLTPQFFEEPAFVVAGVTNTVNRGGHGSETTIRSNEALSKATAALDGRAAPSGDALATIRALQQAAEREPTEANLFAWGAELLVHRAAAQAEEVFAKAARLYPKSSRVLIGLAAAEYSLGAYDKAAERFFEATDVDVSDPVPYRFLGTLENPEIVGRDAYLARLKRFVTLQPANPEANYLYAAAQWRRREDVSAYLAKAGSIADAHVLSGIVQAEAKQYTKAIAEYKTAIEMGTAREEVHYRLAQALQQAGEAGAAAKEFAAYQALRKSKLEREEKAREAIEQFVFKLR